MIGKVNALSFFCQYCIFYPGIRYTTALVMAVVEILRQFILLGVGGGGSRHKQ
jgi:hypothetical protein